MVASIASLVVAAVVARGEAPATVALATPTAAINKLERDARSVKPNMRRHESRRFVLITDVSDEDAERLLATLERTSEAVERWTRELGVEPRPLRERLATVGFAERSAFERFAQKIDHFDAAWTTGYWSPGADRTVFRVEARGAAPTAPITGSGDILAAVASAAEATVAHETAHQLLHRVGVQRRSPNAPLWAAEGLAIGFEPVGSGGAEPFAAQPQRATRLESAASAGSLYSLRALVATPKLLESDAARVELFYDQSWSLARWLATERREAFAGYLAELRQRAGALTPEANLEIFERAFGKVDDVESAWRRTVLTPLARVEPIASRPTSAGCRRQAP